MNDEALAYFITWTCYGTFLPGDDRGWTKWQKGQQLPQPRLEDWCRDQMSESALRLNEKQREIVNQVVQLHCEIRGWILHAVTCRSNHCHVVVTAPNYDAQLVCHQFKSWAKRRLKEHELESNFKPVPRRKRWWTRKGSLRKLFDEESIDAASIYTIEAQDHGGSKLS